MWIEAEGEKVALRRKTPSLVLRRCFRFTLKVLCIRSKRRVKQPEATSDIWISRCEMLKIPISITQTGYFFIYQGVLGIDLTWFHMRIAPSADNENRPPPEYEWANPIHVPDRALVTAQALTAAPPCREDGRAVWATCPQPTECGPGREKMMRKSNRCTTKLSPSILGARTMEGKVLFPPVAPSVAQAQVDTSTASFHGTSSIGGAPPSASSPRLAFESWASVFTFAGSVVRGVLHRARNKGRRYSATDVTLDSGSMGLLRVWSRMRVEGWWWCTAAPCTASFCYPQIQLGAIVEEGGVANKCWLAVAVVVVDGRQRSAIVLARENFLAPHTASEDPSYTATTVGRKDRIPPACPKSLREPRLSSPAPPPRTERRLLSSGGTIAGAVVEAVATGCGCCCCGCTVSYVAGGNESGCCCSMCGSPGEVYCLSLLQRAPARALCVNGAAREPAALPSSPSLRHNFLSEYNFERKPNLVEQCLQHSKIVDDHYFPYLAKDKEIPEGCDEEEYICDEKLGEKVDLTDDEDDLDSLAILLRQYSRQNTLTTSEFCTTSALRKTRFYVIVFQSPTLSQLSSASAGSAPGVLPTPTAGLQAADAKAVAGRTAVGAASTVVEQEAIGCGLVVWGTTLVFFFVFYDLFMVLTRKSSSL
ncbi:hypothetical protein DFJ73DRAFT_965067 [Zopfochytrium polystomum]|nr:hypothetical protein DFJ73DRAFT_965067 [Zopfochytrium polystomum]